MTDGKILIEANEPCDLLYVDYGEQRSDELYGSKRIVCLTVSKGVIAWRNLPPGNRGGARLTTESGKIFKGREIGELHKA